MIEIILIVGLIFDLLAVIGLLRFPDMYTRLHASTKCTTFGSIFVIIYSSITLNQSFLKMFFLILFILLTNPTSAHAIARACYKSGIVPLKGENV